MDARTVKAAVLGPEVWREAGGSEWSFWDLCFCVVCVLDYGGDWAGLDAGIANDRGFDAEAKWSHLMDLTARLDGAGLTAGDLAGEAARDPKVRAKARTTVLKSQLYKRDETGPMRHPPSARLTAQCLFGAWRRFAVSPQPYYDKLRRHVGIEGGRYDSGWATHRLASIIDGSLGGLLARAGANLARQLAARRATLGLRCQAAEIADDSFGYLGDTARDVIEQYARTDWRAAGVSPTTYWRDLLGWCALASNYGLLHRIEVEVFRWATVGPDLDLVDATLVDLVGAFTAARMHWHAEEAEAMWATAVVASRRLRRLAATAEAIGPVRWTAIARLVAAAMRHRRPDLARGVLDVAEAAGVRPAWVRQRPAEIGGGTR